MWQCPNCETLNNDEFCAICGSPRPVQQQNQQQNQQQTQFEKYEKLESNETPEKIKASDKKLPMLGIIIALVAVVVAMAAVIIAIVQNKDEEKKTEVIVVTQPPAETDAPVSAPTDKPVTVTQTPKPATVTQTPEPESSIPADEGTIQKIRDRYNFVVEIVPQCDISTTNSGVKYYYGDKLVRIDVPADYSFNYTRCYYYDSDGELCFAFVFVDDTVENRFYFSDENLIRWIDENDDIHDNEYYNENYSDWEERILTDASNHEV